MIPSPNQGILVNIMLFQMALPRSPECSMGKTTVRSVMVLILSVLIMVSDRHAGSSGPIYLTT